MSRIRKRVENKESSVDWWVWEWNAFGRDVAHSIMRTLTNNAKMFVLEPD